MANGVELATAWVRIIPSMDGVQGQIAKGLGPVAEQEGKKSGKRFGGAMAGAVAGLVAPMAASALQGIKNLVGEMAAQVDSTKKFRSTLEFAGVSDKHIKRLTKATQDYADKTIYNLTDIRNITSQLASNGVKDYDKLAQAAGNLNAIAGGNAETFKSVGMVITQTAGQGKLTAENWNQLADAIPGASGKIQQALQKNGAFVGNFREAMSKGEITSEEFNKALLELGTDPVAVKAAQSTATFEGSIGNLQASIVKVGATILEKLAPAFSQITGVISEVIAGVAPLVEFFFSSPPLMAGVAAVLLTAVAPAIWSAVVATKAWTVALLANPLTWVALAIGAVVGALIWFFTETEVGRKMWAEFTRFISEAWANVTQFLGEAWENITKWIGEAWTNITKATDWAWKNVIKPVITAIGDIFSWLWNYIISPIVTLIVNNFRFWGAVVSWLWTNAVQPAFKAIGDVFNWIWKTIISPIIGWIADKLDFLGKAFRFLYANYVKPAFDNISSVVSSVWKWIDTYVFTPFKKGIDLIGQAFENTAKAIGTAWNGIKKAAAVPINFVLDTVWNKGLRSFWNDMVTNLGLKDMKLPAAKLVKFAKGGVLPGYTPGRDVHEFYSPTAGRLALSGGEAIMRPEFTRLVGGAAGVARLNAMARKGSLGGFKNGGVLDHLGSFAGDVWNNITGVAAVIGDFFTDPVGAVQKHVIEGIIRPLLGQGQSGNLFQRTIGELPIKLVKNLAKSLLGGGGAGQGRPGMGWQAMWNIVQQAIPGIRMTSNYRSPASNKAVGGVKGSYHTRGRAIDLVPANMAMFNQVARLFPNASELIFTPAGGRQLLNGKPFSGWSNAVKRMHYNHIHLAMAQGGVLPGLAEGGTVTRAGHVVVGERGPELLSLPRGAQVNPGYDELPDERPVVFNNYAPLGQTPAQALTQFANRAKGL